MKTHFNYEYTKNFKSLMCGTLSLLIMFLWLAVTIYNFVLNIERDDMLKKQLDNEEVHYDFIKHCLCSDKQLWCHILVRITTITQFTAIALRNDRDILQGISMLDNLTQMSNIF